MHIAGTTRFTYLFRILFLLAVCIILLPFLSGVLGMFFAMFGTTLTWSTIEFSFEHIIRALLDTSLLKSLSIALIRGNVVAGITLLMVFVIGFTFVMSKGKFFQRCNVFFLTVPHVALATGFLFLIAPSGMVFRLLAQFFGWTEPPQVVSVNDTYGISMSVVVLIKIIPFVLFSFVSVLSDYTITSHITQARLMGRNRFTIWAFVIFPQIMPKFILPFFISLVYAISPVDISTIIGPYTPPSFGVEMVSQFLRADRLDFIDANLGSFLLTLATFISIVLWYFIFIFIRKILQRTYEIVRFIPDFTKIFSNIGIISFAIIVCISVVCTALLATWSVVKLWQFPQLIPTEISIDHFFVYRYRLFFAFFSSLFLAIVSACVSLIIVIVILECAPYIKHRTLIDVFMILPLLIPQVVYVAGIHLLFLHININGSFFALVWSHIQYVVPYVFLVLYGPFKEYDNSYVLQGRIMGKSILHTFIAIKFPMLLRPISFALGLAMLVSIAQYLTTLFIGEGRYSTLTLFMISLSSGGSRRMLGSTSMLLIVLNVGVLFLAFMISKLQKGAKEIKL